METARSRLRALPSNGEVPHDGPQSLSEALTIIEEQNRKLNGAWAENARLRNQLAEAQAVEPEAEQILEVLTFWNHVAKKDRCSITIGSERWLKVRARLREKDVRTKKRCYTVLHLKAAVIGALMSDFHVENGYLDATTIFRDGKTVDDHVGRATSFKQRTGVSALTLIDELGGTALEWLADRCSCGGLLLEHLRQGPGALPCPERDCGGFDFFAAKVNRHLERAA